MSWATRLADRLFAPGRVAFATLFAVESLARALLTVVLPVAALAVLGDARDVSLAFTVALCFVVAISQAIPPLLRRFGPHVVYGAAAVLMAAVPLCLSLSNGAGTVAAIVLRALSAACAMNALHLMIMTHIGRRDLARMEPLRVFASAGAWCVAPLIGVRLYEFVSPWAAYGASIAAAALLLCHVAAVRARSRPAAAVGTASPGPPQAGQRFAPWRNLRRFVVQPRLRLAYVLNLSRETWWVLFLIYGPIYMVTSGMGAASGGYLVAAGTALLFTTPLFGRLARRVGMRPVIMGGFAAVGLGALLAAAATPWPYAFAACILASAVGAMALDSVTMVTFQRAVHARERPEMTVVFATYRDVALLASTAVFGLLLSFLGLWCVFAAAGLWLSACAWLARHVPRGM